MTEADIATACIANIGFRERRRRARFGAVLIAAGTGLAVLWIAIDVHRLWRLSSFLPCCSRSW